jgi:hypothetical protein
MSCPDMKAITDLAGLLGFFVLLAWLMWCLRD